MRAQLTALRLSMLLLLSAGAADAWGHSVRDVDVAGIVTQAQATEYVNPFRRNSSPNRDVLVQPETAGDETSSSNLETEDREGEAENPFGRTSRESTGAASVRCGAESSLSKAELRKPEMAIAVCQKDYTKLDEQWMFILYYVKGFNDFLEERGSFMDPTGACARSAEPRHRLGLIYEGMDFVLGRGDGLSEDARLERMLEPFREDWKRAPMIWLELKVWEREGRLDATSVATRGMCSDPEFQFFWERVLEYAQRVPGTSK